MNSYVAVVGQIARDLALHLPELPGPGSSGRVAERREALGGKGANIAVGLAQLGTPVALLGVVGDDHTGALVLARAGADGIDTTPVIRRENTTTALIVDVVANGEWRYLQDIPDATLLTAADVHDARATIENAATVVIQLQQPAAAARAVAEIAHAKGTKIILDGCTADDELLELADVVRADAREAELLTGETGEAAARAIRQRGPRVVAVEAADGNVFAWDDRVRTVPLTDEHVVDTTGAGDALVATLTHALLHGEPPWTAARRAVQAAGRTVRHLGGRPDLGSSASIRGTSWA